MMEWNNRSKTFHTFPAVVAHKANKGGGTGRVVQNCSAKPNANLRATPDARSSALSDSTQMVADAHLIKLQSNAIKRKAH
jgi:hypothetical protein